MKKKSLDNEIRVAFNESRIFILWHDKGQLIATSKVLAFLVWSNHISCTFLERLLF